MILEKVYDELMAQIEDLKKAVAGGGSGTKNYNDLDNRPYINSKLLTGNKNSKQIGVAEYITAENYAALESPSEHEIYFVSDRPAVVAWGFSKSTAQIHWTEGDNTYTATVSAAIGAEGDYYKSIISATVDDESVTIVSSELEHSPVNGVVMTISCDDPTAITSTSLVFMFSFAAETGQRQIIHNGMEFGSGKPDFTNSDEIVVGTWIDGSPIYRKILSLALQLTNADWYDLTSATGIDKCVGVFCLGKDRYVGNVNACASNFSMRINNGKIQILNQSNWQFTVETAVIFYTKS